MAKPDTVKLGFKGKGDNNMATVFGALSIALGLLGSFLIGWIGVGIVVVFALIAIIFRIRKNKANPDEPQKISSIVCGIIGLVLAIITQIGVSAYAGKMKDTAIQMGDVPLIAEGAAGLKTLGLLGFYSTAMDAKGDMSDTEFENELKIQLDKVTKKISE